MDEKITITIEKDLYPIEAIYTVSYMYLDSTYIFLKKGTENNILIELTPKEKIIKKEEISKLKNEFLNQLLNYSHQLKTNNKNKFVKELLLKEIFYGTEEAENNQNENKKVFSNNEIEDPEGILTPWEEKYGNNKE